MKFDAPQSMIDLLAAAMSEVLQSGAELDAAKFAERHPEPVLLLAETTAQAASSTGFRTLGPSGAPAVQEAPASASDLLWRVAKRPGVPFPDKVTVGRSSNNDVMLPFGQVSKLHAVFCRDRAGGPDAWMVTDVGSSNGTRMNGQRIDAHTAWPLADGDLLDFGGGLQLTFLMPRSLHRILPAITQLLAS